MARRYAPDIPPRVIRFKRTSQKLWCQNDPWLTYHFNAVALLSPVFEKMVIASIRKVASGLPEKLLSEVNSLIMQEGHHAREFDAFIKDMIAPYYTIEFNGNRLKWFRWVVNKMPHSYQLAASAFGEHFTTVSSEMMLGGRDWFEGLDPSIADVWRWHSIEEIEHKSVAFDVYKHFYSSYWIRVSSMFVFTSLFAIQYLRCIFQMLKQDKKSIFWGFIRMVGLHWFAPGVFRRFSIPFFDYLRPTFHPEQRQNRHLVIRHLAALKPYLLDEKTS